MPGQWWEAVLFNEALGRLLLVLGSGGSPEAQGCLPRGCRAGMRRVVLVDGALPAEHGGHRHVQSTPLGSVPLPLNLSSAQPTPGNSPLSHSYLDLLSQFKQMKTQSISAFTVKVTYKGRRRGCWEIKEGLAFYAPFQCLFII